MVLHVACDTLSQTCQSEHPITNSELTLTTLPKCLSLDNGGAGDHALVSGDQDQHMVSPLVSLRPPPPHANTESPTQLATRPRLK